MIDLKIYEPAYKKQALGCKKKVDALGNPVEMKMSLQQFADKWIQSGHWDERGIKKGQYCMARNNDIGHYEWDNVRIITNSENSIEANKGRTHSDETKAKMSVWQKGKPKPPRPADHCNNLSAAIKAIPKTQCPHCGIWVAPTMLKRWHDDNCKKKGG